MLVRAHSFVHNIPPNVDNKECVVSKNMTLNVRITGALGDFVAESVGEYGTYENVSEYVRDLIRKDKEQVDAARMEALRAELAVAFAAPDATYEPLTAEEVITRSRRTRQAR
jgi:putative addiction module CopG family antidote